MTFIDISDLPIKEPRDGWRGRFFHSQNMSFAYYEVSAGAWIHEHVRTCFFRDPDGMDCEIAIWADGPPRSFEERILEPFQREG